MRVIRSLILLLLVCSCALSAHAQSNPPFQNPSLDTDCYFPQIGDPTQMDTIVGSQPNQDLGGSIIRNLGPKPDGSLGDMLIGNISPSVALTQVETGSTFNLHNLKSHPQNFDPTVLSGGYVLGHFRDTKHLDLFTTGRIYWADESGNYDSSRYSVITFSKRGDRHVDRGLIEGALLPYTAKLTSDTVEDIIMSYLVDYTDFTKDSNYVALFRGGASLFGRDTIFEDTSVTLLTNYLSSTPMLSCTQGDFRGVGRDDLIVADPHGNFCYYRNDPPFSLSQFAQSVVQDTLYAHWQDPVIYANNATSFLTMRALPKAPGDHSVDFVPVLNNTIYSGPAIFIFRGGPEFGSHRITFDSTAFVITNPFTSDYLWPYSIADAGDMTGTGNHVLYTAGAWSDDDQTDNFYVTGKALDNKIDIYNLSNSGSRGDTLTANNDSLEDFLLTRAGGTGSGDYGTLWLYYGSKNIPVHLNPQFADVRSIPQENGAGISFAPNPAQLWTVATIIWPESEDGEYSIYDMLGRQMEHGSIRLYGGAEQQRIYFSGMPQGVYIYTIEGAHGSASARFVKLGGASGATGGLQPSIIQQMKQARDGIPASLSTPSLPH